MDEIGDLVAAVRQSAHYRTIHPDVIARVGAAELARRRGFKDAVKATKSRLHQTAGSFFHARPPYQTFLTRLRAASEAGDEDALRDICRDIMRHQASTRERLPVLDTFFAVALEPIAPVRSVLDLACGLDPLAAPWMPLAPGADYWACDVYEDLTAFLGEALPLIGVTAHVWCGDAINPLTTRPVDLCLLLKAIPSLDQLDRTAAERLLTTVEARHFLISFPVRSLGGREKGMIATYEARMARLLSGGSWSFHRIQVATELAFLVSPMDDEGGRLNDPK